MPTYSGSTTSSAGSWGSYSYTTSTTAPPGTTVTYSGTPSSSGGGSGSSSSLSKFDKSVKTLGDGANLLIKAAIKLATISYEKDLENLSRIIDNAVTEMTAASQKSLMAVSLQGQTYVSAVQSTLTSFTQGINEAAYASAASALEIGAQEEIRKIENDRIDKLSEQTIKARDVANKATLSNLDAQMVEAANYYSSELVRMAAHIADDVEFEVFGIGGSTGKSIGNAADRAVAIEQSAVSANTAVTQMINKSVVALVEGENKLNEIRINYEAEYHKQRINNAKEVAKAYLQYTETIEQLLLKFEAGANDMGISMGYHGAQLDEYKHRLLETNKTIAKWGKTMEDAAQIQNEYQFNTGRNVVFNDRDFDTTFALDYLGGKNGLSTQLSSAMQPFNKSVSTANDMVFQMFKNVSRMGLNGRKYMQDLVKNLKLANKYQFNGGVKNLMQMAAWAQKTKFNMDSLDSMLDKVHEGGLEGIITQSAQLQVLGGAAAMGADPLAMAWEAYNDPKAYAERMQSMTRDMGTFDKKTGETYFNMADQMRIEAMAKAQGRSKEDLMTEIKERNKRDQINKVTRGRYNDEQLTNISSHSFWKDGQWQVELKDGNFKPIDSLSEADLQNLMPVETEERIEEYVKDIRDMMTQLEGAKSEMNAQAMRDTYDTWYEEELKRIQNIQNEFRENYNKYITEITQNMKFITDSYTSMTALASKGQKDIDDAMAGVRKSANNLASIMDDLTSEIAKNIKKLNSDFVESKVNEAKKQVSSSVVNKANEYKTSSTTTNSSDNKKSEPKKPTNPKIEERAKSGYDGSYMHYFGSRGSILDGIVQSDGTSTLVNASKVTPVHDGTAQIAKTDPQDTAIFAKTGGPFDTLFNGIFKQITHADQSISELYQSLNTPFGFISNEMQKAMGSFDGYSYNNHSVTPIDDVKEQQISHLSIINQSSETPIPSRRETSPQVRELPFGFISNEMQKAMGSYSSSNNGEVKIAPIKIEMSGRLELGSNGQYIDIMKALQDNPEITRALTHLISESISRNMSGGKVVNKGGQLVGNIGFSGH